MKKDILNEIETALYQIHSMADTLGMIIADNPVAMESIKNTNNRVSCPFISFTDMIREKAEFCLKAIDNDSKEVAA